MGYNVSALPSYTKQDAKKLLNEQLFSEVDTLKLMQIRPGIKSSETLDVVATEGVWQAQACSFAASGDTVFSRRTLTVGKIQVALQWCEQDLEPYFLQEEMKAGGSYDSLTFNEKIIGETMANVRKRLETAIWKGDLQSTDAYLKHFDGLVDIIEAASIGGTYSSATTAWSQANSRTVMLGLAALVVANSNINQSDIKFFMNKTMAQQYRWKLISDNLYHITGTDNKLYVEGTNIEIIPTEGLTGVTKIFAIEPQNMYFGTDMTGEFEDYKVWFSDDDQVIKFLTRFKAGVQIPFPSRVYKYA
jgi:hypothetical protein